MGQYDIESQFNDSLKLTMAELYDEIGDEKDDDENCTLDYDSLKKKFKNSDRSGIIDKLNDKLNFDIESIGKRNKQEKFDMLKLLKVLYYIEKDGYYRYNRRPKHTSKEASEKKIPIIDILANPHVENIKSEELFQNEHGNVFNDLFSKIRKQVNDSESRISVLNQIDNKWEMLSNELLNYVITDDALKNSADAIAELNRIDIFVKSVLTKTEHIKKLNIPPKEGVMSTFFNILICHHLLCIDAGQIDVYEQLERELPDKNLYADDYLKFEKQTINLNNINKKDITFARNHKLSSDFLSLLKYINYNSPVDENDYKYYRFAFKYFDIVANWLLKNANACFEDDGSINKASFIAIIQELVYICKNPKKIKNKCFGINNNKVSLTAQLKKGDDADQIFKEAWVTRVRNRIAIDFGATELIIKKMCIEATIFNIKKIIYSYQNIDDLILINNTLYRWIYRSTISRSLAYNAIKDMLSLVIKNLSEKEMKFQFTIECERVFHLGREMIMNSSIKNNVSQAITSHIKYSYSQIHNLGQKFLKICSHNKGFMLGIKVDTLKKQILFIDFYDLESDEDTKRLQELGLDKFIR